MTSPVTTIFEPNPSRVRNIFICSGLVFCASSRITNESLSVLPAHERQRRDLDDPAVEVGEDPFGVEHVVQGVEERAQVGVDLRLDVAGQEPEPLPRLDGGRVRMIRLMSRASSAATAIATARNVLPVPAGPMPKVTVWRRIGRRSASG